MKLAVDDWKIDPSHIAAVQSDLKWIYDEYLSLACAATAAGYRSERNECAEGVVEVGQLAILLSLKGLENPSCVLLRQSIELTLKQVYFKTHPTEYSWAQKRPDFRGLTFSRLIEYFRMTDEYKLVSDTKSICDELNHWYGVLSRHVHVHSRGFLGYSQAGTGYLPRIRDISRLTTRTSDIWPCLVSVFVLFYKPKYMKASWLEQKLISRGLPREVKQRIWQDPVT